MEASIALEPPSVRMARAAHQQARPSAPPMEELHANKKYDFHPCRVECPRPRRLIASHPRIVLLAHQKPVVVGMFTPRNDKRKVHTRSRSLSIVSGWTCANFRFFEVGETMSFAVRFAKAACQAPYPNRFQHKNKLWSTYNCHMTGLHWAQMALGRRQVQANAAITNYTVAQCPCCNGGVQTGGSETFLSKTYGPDFCTGKANEVLGINRLNRDAEIGDVIILGSPSNPMHTMVVVAISNGLRHAHIGKTNLPDENSHFNPAAEVPRKFKAKYGSISDGGGSAPSEFALGKGKEKDPGGGQSPRSALDFGKGKEKMRTEEQDRGEIRAFMQSAMKEYSSEVRVRGFNNRDALQLDKEFKMHYDDFDRNAGHLFLKKLE